MHHLAVQVILVAGAAALVGLPALTLLHEIAHGLAAALLIGGRVTIVQGPAPARVELSVWRLRLRLHGPVAPQHAWVGWALWGPHADRWRHVLATAAGPAASAGSSALCALGAWRTTGDAALLLSLLAAGAGGQTLSSASPVRYGRRFGAYAGEASDGLRVRRLLQGRPEPAPEPLGPAQVV